MNYPHIWIQRECDLGLSGIDMLSIDSTADDSHDTLFPSIIVVARKGFASELDD